MPEHVGVEVPVTTANACDSRVRSARVVAGAGAPPPDNAGVSGAMHETFVPSAPLVSFRPVDLRGGVRVTERSNAMLCQSSPGTRHLLSLVCAAAMLLAPSAFGQQPLRATVVHVEGVPDTWHVTDKDGKIVEVHVPAQSLIDIQTSQEAQPGTSGPAGQERG